MKYLLIFSNDYTNGRWDYQNRKCRQDGDEIIEKESAE